MTRSGGYSDQDREEQLQRDKVKREAEAANRRLRKVYAAAEQAQEPQPGMQQPPHQQDLQISDDEDHEFYDPEEGGAGAGGNGGDDGGDGPPGNPIIMPPKYDEATMKPAKR